MTFRTAVRLIINRIAQAKKKKTWKMKWETRDKETLFYLFLFLTLFFEERGAKENE